LIPLFSAREGKREREFRVVGKRKREGEKRRSCLPQDQKENGGKKKKRPAFLVRLTRKGKGREGRGVAVHLARPKRGKKKDEPPRPSTRKPARGKKLRRKKKGKRESLP